MTITEYLTGSQDWVTCRCGNEPHTDGFYACDERGAIVTPTEAEWKTNLYVCIRCGRYFDNDTLKVVGVTDLEVSRSNGTFDWDKY